MTSPSNRKAFVAYKFEKEEKESYKELYELFGRTFELNKHNIWDNNLLAYMDVTRRYKLSGGDITDEDVLNKYNIITDIKFLTFGCVAAIATSSVATTIVKGKTLDEAELITRKAVAEALDGLPPIKMHCSNLAADALYKAIVDYKKKHDIPLTQEEILKEQKIDEEDHI